MFTAPISASNLDELSRCEERDQAMDHGKSLTKTQKTDAAVKKHVEHAIWNDDVLRSIEHDEMDVHVKNGVVYLNGHIAGATSESRIRKAIRDIPGILGIQNNLVLDDKLTNEVAASLGMLEHTYACKFFTGASHGVVSLNGIVSDVNVKSLAEKNIAANPHVRAVINNIQVSGVELEMSDQPFLQPTIGETIYFLDGISGVVRQVIMNPNNRRVVAMTVSGLFAEQHQKLKSFNKGENRSPEHLVVLSMDLVRYLTKISGFLYISSNEKNRYMDFNSTRFFTPQNDWKAPYPYCFDDVLFPVEKQEPKYQILEQSYRTPETIALEQQLLWEQLLVDENLGG
jgi:osmotically-inducible protein OsmY